MAAVRSDGGCLHGGQLVADVPPSLAQLILHFRESDTAATGNTDVEEQYAKNTMEVRLWSR
eukprot:3194386-Pyramimonas_sp.AAC.1